jgi:hypothetical protein
MFHVPLGKCTIMPKVKIRECWHTALERLGSGSGDDLAGIVPAVDYSVKIQ